MQSSAPRASDNGSSTADAPVRGDVPLISSAPTELPSALLCKLRLRLLPLLWISYAVSMADRSNIAFAQLKMIQPPPSGLGLSISDFGLAAGIFFLPFALAQLPVSILVTRVGSTRMLAGMLLAWGFIAASTGLVRSRGALFILRFALGLAESGFYPTVIYYLAQWFPGRAAGQAVAVLMTAGPIGWMISSLTAGPIMDGLHGAGGLEGWRWLFIVQALPAVLMAPVLVVCLPERPEGVGWLSMEERAHMAQLLHKPGGANHSTVYTTVLETVRRKATWIFGITQFTLQMMSYVQAFFQPILIHATLPWASVSQIGIIAMVPSVISICTSPVYATFADYGSSNARRFKYAGAISVAAALVVMFAGIIGNGAVGNAATQGSGWIALALFVLSVAMVPAGFGPIWSLHHAVQPPNVKPYSIPIVNAVGNVGGFVGPYLVGWIHDAIGTSCIAQPSQHGQLDCFARYGHGFVVVGIFALVSLAASAVGIVKLNMLNETPLRTVVRSETQLDGP